MKFWTFSVISHEFDKRKGKGKKKKNVKHTCSSFFLLVWKYFLFICCCFYFFSWRWSRKPKIFWRKILKINNKKEILENIISYYPYLFSLSLVGDSTSDLALRISKAIHRHVLRYNTYSAAPNNLIVTSHLTTRQLRMSSDDLCHGL